MTRRMADATFRTEQKNGIYAAHVEAINKMIDRLREHGGRGWLPHVAPLHGGNQARVLSVLRDPGPKTLDDGGSGLLCIENDDPTAEAQCHAFAEADIQLVDITPWNAYPWYINRAPTAAERQAGVQPLTDLIDLLPNLRVILLQGRDAQDVWRRLIRRYPDVVALRRLDVVATFHPGRQALWSADPVVRASRARHRTDALHRAATILGKPLEDFPPSDLGQRSGRGRVG